MRLLPQPGGLDRVEEETSAAQWCVPPRRATLPLVKLLVGPRQASPIAVSAPVVECYQSHADKLDVAKYLLSQGARAACYVIGIRILPTSR